jgi:prevent-host-death family protein
VIIEISAKNFRQNLGDMLNQVHTCGDSILINEDGTPIAALVDARLFARIRRMQARFDALSQRLVQGFDRVPLDEGIAEFEAAVKAARATR